MGKCGRKVGEWVGKWGAGRGRFVWLIFHLFSPFYGVFPGLIALFLGFSPRFSFPRGDFSTLCGEWGRKYGMDWLLFCWIIRVLGEWGMGGCGLWKDVGKCVFSMG